MLIEEEVDGTPNQALFAVWVVGHIIGRIAVKVALRKIHLLIDCLPHCRQGAIDINAEVKQRRIEGVHDIPQTPLAAEITRPEDARKVVVGVGGIQGSDHVGKRLARPNLIERAER